MEIEGWIEKTESGGQGLANVVLYTGLGAFSSTSNTGYDCTLSLEGSAANNQFAVAAGSVYARFDCPTMMLPPALDCQGSGAFVFEQCSREDSVER